MTKNEGTKPISELETIITRGNGILMFAMKGEVELIIKAML